MSVAAKKVQVSIDDTTYYTLPGNTGQVENAGASLDDTVFGQAFQSMQPSLISAKITANAFFKGFAGYVATLKKTGTSTSFTAEASTNTSAHKYQVTNAAKRVLDHTIPLVMWDGVTDVSVNIVSVDYLFGIVDFGAFAPAGAITFHSGNYLPLATIANAGSFTLTQTCVAENNTDLASAQSNGGYDTFIAGLKTVALEIKGFYNVANGFVALLQGRTEFVIELCPDGTGKSVARGFFKLMSDISAGNVGAIETDDLKFVLTVPDVQNMVAPFSWVHTATTLNTGVQELLTNFLSGTNIYVKYLPDGTTGVKGSGVITDVTLTGGTTAMNTFATIIQISGALTATP